MLLKLFYFTILYFFWVASADLRFRIHTKYFALSLSNLNHNSLFSATVPLCS